ncbi:MAG TPA: outer membrane protein assembly factor BamA [Melioribacteraceae bacterium]|nr:outer membrane protein assembly factor BamA [Melioribacteraceae bacterium]
MQKPISCKLLKYNLFIFFFLSSFIFSQNREHYQILGITVEGNKTTDASIVIANSGLKVNDEIDVPGDETINAIKRLWNLNIFSEVSIDIAKQIDNGVFLVIKVKEFPRLADKVYLSGNDEIDEEEINAKINFVKGQTLKTQEIYRVKQKIQKLYIDEGFLNSEITPIQYNFVKADTSKNYITVTWADINDSKNTFETEYEYDRDSKTDVLGKMKERNLLVYHIMEGEVVKVNEIRFAGNNAFTSGELKSEFDETSEAVWWKFWSSGKLKKDDYVKDKELLEKFYKKNGYRDFEIISDTLIYHPNKKRVDIVITVNEGTQYKIKDIIWQGNTVYADDALAERLDVYKGEVYDFDKFQKNLYFNEKQTDVSSLYQDNGYLGFNLELKEEKVADDSLNIIIKINENNRFKINRVEITGNTKTKDKVIRRELYVIPGDYFSRNNIFRSIQQLANLQYFNVEKLYQEGIDYRPTSDSTVNLILKVEEKSSDYLNASIGYSGSYGFSGALGVTLTNFSAAEPFQMGAGQVLNFNWQFGVGNYFRTFTLGFTEPWFMDTPTLVGFEVFDTRQKYIYDLRQSGGSVKVGRRLTWPDNYFYVQGSFKFQYNDVIDGRGYYNEGLTRQYTLGLGISRTDIDNPIFPSRGSKVSLNAEVSGGLILPGDVDYYKLEFTTDWYRRLFNSSRITLYTGIDLGYLDEIVPGTSIQPFEFFFMGGNGLIIATTPLRGYEDRSVGPINSDGNIIGGRVKAKYTAELRAALALEPIPIYLLLFAEAGNTFKNASDFDFYDLKRSVGIGARLLINPIGLIGFDFGYGFDRKSVDGKDPEWVFHFQFGKGF